jgi:zinc transport system ATP-binding protein
MPILTVTNLTVEFNHNKILDCLNFTLEPSQTLAVIGPNGAGKTILFKALLGLVPYSGQISWDKDVKIGYVPQRFSVESDLPLTVSEFFSLKKCESKDIIHALTHVNFKNNLKHILNSKLGTLSGGQLQRILIAWAIVDNPNVLLFDEPTTGVDISAEESIYNLLHNLQKEHQMSILLISHELQVVYRYATNVLCLNKEGICFGPPHKTLTEKNLAQLFGENTSIYHHQHLV